MKKLQFLLLLLFVLQTSFVVAQKVSNISYRQEQSLIIISYDLETKTPCKVNLYVSTNGGATWQGPLTKVSGDVGAKIASGSHTITWKVLEEFEELRGDKIQFQVRAVQDTIITMVEEKAIFYSPDSKEKNMEKNEDNTVYNTASIEVEPEFLGGMENFYSFVQKNFQMPDEEGLKGKVYLTFVVEKDGSLTDIKVLRDIGYGTGKEAVRVLKTTPRWNPGEQNGKKVRCTFSLPISLQSAK
jgi:hypothetical protein